MQTYEQLLKNAPARIYVTPTDFLRACVDYFRWAENNPLEQEQVFQNRGEIIRASVSKVRAFTLKGLAAYLGTTVKRIEDLGQRGEEWSEALEMVYQVIFNQKFENASAGLLNAGIISRDLGLADKQEVTGRDGEPLQQVVQYQLPANGR